MPRVSIVIPAYNAAPWIAETLKSVLVQEYDDFEVIVVDDGSTDNTTEIVGNFEQVRCVHQPNAGLSSARNAGIRAANSEYVAFLDADDLWTPDKLRLQMELLGQSGFVWAFSDAYAFDDETRHVLFAFSKVRSQYDGDVLSRLFLANFIPSPTPIIKRSIFDKVGCFDERVCVKHAEDVDMWLRIAARFPIGLVKRRLAWYRVHAASIIQSESPSVLYQDNLNAIELAASRERKRLAPLRNRSVALLSIRVGQMFVRRKNLAYARKMFAQAIRLAPTELPAYAYWLGTFAGRRMTSGYVKFLHWLRQKRSGSAEFYIDRPTDASSH